MPQVKADFIERVPDEGQWFERGTRVGFFEPGRPGRRQLEPAVLGSYEVLRCARLEADGARWLSVTLRPFGLLEEHRRRRDAVVTLPRPKSLDRSVGAR